MPSILRTSPVVAVLALVVACSGGAPETADGPVGDGQPSATATATATESPSPASAPGGSGDTAGNAEVLSFTAPTLDGGTFDAAAYAGQDVILWMWAPW